MHKVRPDPAAMHVGPASYLYLPVVGKEFSDGHGRSPWQRAYRLPWCRGGPQRVTFTRMFACHHVRFRLGSGRHGC